MKTIKIDIKQGTQMNISSINSARQLPCAKKHGSPGRLKQVSQSIMVGLLSVSIALPHFAAFAQSPVLNAAASNEKSEQGRLSSDMTLQSSVVSNVKLPNAEYVESQVDMRIKTLGGEIKLERIWMNGRWYLNTTWANLRFVADPLDGSVKTVDRAGTLFQRSGDTTLFSSGNVHIQKTDGGWRWYNRDGDWVSYDEKGRMLGYGDRNGINVTFVLDEQGRRIAIKDHHGETVYRFEYNQNELLTRVIDKIGRSVSYEWQGERLIAVTDLSGNVWQYHYNNDGQIIQRQEPDGGSVNIAYSYSMAAAKPEMVSGIHSGVTEDSGVVSSKRVNSDSKIARVGRITDKSGAITLYQSQYDKASQNYTITVEEPAGRKTVKYFNGQGQLKSIYVNDILQSTIQHDGTQELKTTDIRGLTTTVRYDVDKRPIQVVHKDGTSEYFEYDNRHNQLIRYVDVLGVVTVWEYDSNGNVLKQIEAQGLPEERVSIYRYDRWGQLINLTEGSGDDFISVSFTYDNVGNIASFKDGEGNIYHYQYTVDGQLAILQTPLGKTWRYSYDNGGRLISQSDPLGNETHYVYNKVGQLTQTIDPLGNSTRYQQELSQDSWAIIETNSLGEAHRTIYDLTSNTLQVVFASGLSQRLQYDIDGHLIEMNDTTGYRTTLEYGLLGSLQANQVVTANYPTFKETYAYDKAGMVTETRRYLDEKKASILRTEYNAKGLPMSVARSGQIISLYEYDAFGNLLVETNAMAADTRQSYGKQGQLKEVFDANNNRHRYLYDKNINLVGEVMPTGDSIQYFYNEDALLTQRKDAVGNKTSYDYDDARRLIKETFTAAGEATSQQTVTYRYNETNQLIEVLQDGNSNSHFTYTLDALGRKVEEQITYDKGSRAFTLTLAYRYDADGNLTGLTYPDGNEVTFSRENGLLKQSVLANNKKIEWKDYRWFMPATISFPSSEKTIEYDALLRPVHIQVKANGALLLNRAYDYNDADLIESITSQSGEISYRYDRADRLMQTQPSQELQDKGMPIESYAYDRVGNRVGSNHQPGEWQYGPDNRLLQMGDGDALTSFEYTANGNVSKETTLNSVRSYIYNAADRLEQVKKDAEEIVSYSYDPFGRRMSKTVNDITTWYLYSNEGLIAELDESGNMRVAYGWEPDTFYGTAPLWQANLERGQTLNNGQYHYLFTDHLGTPQIAVNGQGQITWQGNYQAFGQVLLDSSTQVRINLRFPGQYYDSETDSHYNYFRDYNQSLGRYQQRDPIGLEGGINSYGYVEGNPIMLMDSMGLKSCLADCAMEQFGIKDLIAVSGVVLGTESLAKPFGGKSSVLSYAIHNIEIKGKSISNIRGRKLWSPTWVPWRPTQWKKLMTRTTSYARFVTRWIPIVSWAVLIYDGYQIYECNKECNNETNNC